MKSGADRCYGKTRDSSCCNANAIILTSGVIVPTRDDYVEPESVSDQSLRYTDGSFDEGLYVDGKRHGPLTRPAAPTAPQPGSNSKP